MKQTKRHTIQILTAMLLLLVFSDMIYAQQAAGITTDKATRITAPVTLTVQSGSNYIRFDEDRLPAVVTYIPSASFGTIPMALVMGDTVEAEVVFADCGMTWRWAIEEAESDLIVEIKAHESATIMAAPHTCDNTSSDTIAVACDSLLWKGEWRYASGDYEYVTTNAAGCDSIVTLHLTINHPTTGEETFAECDSLFWNGEWRKESGDYEYHTKNAAGCDSTAILHLTIHHEVSVTLNDTAVCETDFGYEYIWTDPIKDTAIHEAGTYTRHFKTAFGCDSVVTQTVRFLDMTHGETTITAYDSYTTNIGQTYVTSWENGGPIDYYTNAAGCDSIVNIHLYIRHLQVIDTFPLTVCASELPFQWYGKSYMESGQYSTDTIHGEAVSKVYMDTVHTVNLTVLPVSAGDTTATACESFIWYGTTYAESGDYDHTLVGANRHGCDSVVTLHLTINHATAGDTTATACEAFTWYGTTYTESGDYNHTLSGANIYGCDSVVTLHLAIYHATSGETTAMACESFEWHGTNYTESGDYTFDTKNIHGCDSTATLHLTIYHATAGEESRTEYESYTWYGTTYTESGDYTFETKNSHGCDSTATLHLTIEERPHVDYTYDTVYFCQGYNTEHEELISETQIRRYRKYRYESPAEWAYRDGLVVATQDHRIQLDLRHVEESLEAYYIGELEPIKKISWIYRKDGETALENLTSAAEPIWKDYGYLTIEVRFICGHVFAETIKAGSTEGVEDIDAADTSVRKILKDGQIYLLYNGVMYDVWGRKIAD